MRKTAEQLKLSADQLVNDVKETGTTMEDYRRQASSDKARASEVRLDNFYPLSFFVIDGKCVILFSSFTNKIIQGGSKSAACRKCC